MTIPMKHCLLVVDDEPDVGDSIHDLLRRDYRVLRATSAEEGSRLLLENEVHVILTDQRMPKVSGVELLTNACVKHPKAVRVLFTGFADLESIIAAINHGHIFQFLRKPWQPGELQAAIGAAAAEYDRLVQEAEEKAAFQTEIKKLWEQLRILEAEVRRLREGIRDATPSDKGPENQ